ncbi:response regulator transcription factor [Actinocorallia sp. A-T 12471]|uniref:response regulator transcription factor n=1 Tax=Actinocorallia sp. A-T 12471 TaxID=3089813 RepID=UPI0029CFC331|nr:response regulator transcription factor [Actinocorallia sp. A-T 12471]MDX6742806.1 response regulator transcription factor [Actinocorallia sp. A-T 12471]
MIKVVLADDQALLRGTLRYLLSREAGMEVVGEASEGGEAIALAVEARADLVIMDIRMPGMDGLEATRKLKEALPACKVLILTTFELDEYVFEALRAGASGFLGKGVEPVDLLNGIRTVAAGESLLSPAATKALIARFRESPGNPPRYGLERLADLTPREREVLSLVAWGLSNDDISLRLHLSPHTVKTHINRTMSKLGVSDRAQLVVIAYETGLVRPGER